MAKASEESCFAKTSISGAAVKCEIVIVGRIMDLAIDRCEEYLHVVTEDESTALPTTELSGC